jgi:hypothetical protein
MNEIEEDFEERKQSWLYLRYYSSICLEGMGKAIQ